MPSARRQTQSSRSPAHNTAVFPQLCPAKARAVLLSCHKVRWQTYPCTDRSPLLRHRLPELRVKSPYPSFHAALPKVLPCAAFFLPPGSYRFRHCRKSQTVRYGKPWAVHRPATDPEWKVSDVPTSRPDCRYTSCPLHQVRGLSAALSSVPYPPARFSDGCKILQFRTSGQPPFVQSATSGAQFSSSISFRQLASASLCFC